MYESFTDRARRAVVLAQEEARLMQSDVIGTEHLLLSLLRDEDGVAAHILERLGKDLSAIRAEVLDLVGENHERDTEGHTRSETAWGPEADESKRDRGDLLRRAIPIVVAVAILGGGTAIARRRGYLIGRNLIVRCRQGHLFTTIWLPGASLKSIRLGWARIQRCPVGKHWSVVTPVREEDLSDEERRSARVTRDIRIP